MLPRAFYLVLTLALLAVSACSAVVPSEVEDRSTDVMPDQHSGGSQDSQADAVFAPDALDRDQVEKESEAVRFLLNNAERALEVEDYSRAQALVDRALRIDRETARAYWISAHIQAQLGNSSRAQALASRGLLYTSEESEVGRKLMKITGR